MGGCGRIRTHIQALVCRPVCRTQCTYYMLVNMLLADNACASHACCERLKSLQQGGRKRARRVSRILLPTRKALSKDRLREDRKYTAAYPQSGGGACPLNDEVADLKKPVLETF